VEERAHDVGALPRQVPQERCIGQPYAGSDAAQGIGSGRHGAARLPKAGEHVGKLWRDAMRGNVDEGVDARQDHAGIARLR